MGTPDFPKRDPAGPEFWDLRYGACFAPWDAGKVPARLRDFVASRSAPGGVLVPGCGSARDVRYFAQCGWPVVGIDFSPEALATARRELGSHAGLVRRADFFAPIAGEPFAMVYERAFLCALPRRMWKDWATRVAQLVAPAGVLAGFFYFDAGDRGPPFALHSQEELDALLGDAFERDEDAAVDDSVPVFQGRERWQVWRRRV